MAHSDEIVRQRQCAIRREMGNRGIALKAVAFDSGIPYPTLLTYFPEEGGAKPVMLPVSALYALLSGKALPHDMLSQLMPAGVQIVAIPDSIDHDELEQAALEFLAHKGKAHHPKSEAGREIGPGEGAGLNSLAGKLAAVAA